MIFVAHFNILPKLVISIALLFWVYILVHDPGLEFLLQGLRLQLCEAVSDADGPGVYLMPAKWPVSGLQLPLLNVIIVGFLPCVAVSVRAFRIHRFKEMTSCLTYKYDCLWCFLLGLDIESVIVWLELFELINVMIEIKSQK